MSLNINTNYVSGVYALGEWHEVVPGSFEIDSYQLWNNLDKLPGEEEVYEEDHVNTYDLGKVFDEIEPSPALQKLNELNVHNGLKIFSRVPGGMDGCRWQTPDGNYMCVSLLQIEGWRHLPQ